MFASCALSLAAACSLSSSGTTAGSPSDSGAPAEAAAFSPVADGAAAEGGGLGMVSASCGQLAPATDGGAAACPTGQTCCTTLSLASLSVSAACTAKDQCSGGVSNECQSGVDCASGNVCCSGAATTDASAPTGVEGGILGGLPLAAFDTTCQASCQPGQTQQCASDMECPGGQTCQSIAPAAGGGGFGGFGGAGAAGAFMIAKTCAARAPDAGSTSDADSTPPSNEAGGDL